MNFYIVMKLLHILAAFWFCGGLLGRDISFWRAGSAKDVHEVAALLRLSDFFERWGVIFPSLAVSVFGLLITWMMGWPLFGFLQGGNANWLLVSAFLFLAISALIGPLRLVPRRRQRSAALENALSQGHITGDLSAALHDRVVNGFRKTELAIVVLIIILMVTKPF